MMRFALAVTMVLALPAPGWADFDDVRWSHIAGQFGGEVKVYSGV